MGSDSARQPFRLASQVLAAWLVIALAATAAAQQEAALTMQIESAGQPAMEMTYYIGQGSLRMDMPQGATMIWTGDTTLMVQHPQKSYMEWGPDQMKMMQQMMARVPQGGDAQAGNVDPTRVQFRETGRNEQIGAWNAFEVEMTGLPDGQTGSLWMTRDLGIGMFEAMAQVGDTMQSMPMFAGSTGPGQEMTRYRELATASGMPQGQVVRIVGSDKGQTTTTTLVSVTPGPLPADTFSAPAGYTRMQMPSFPGR